MDKQKRIRDLEGALARLQKGGNGRLQMAQVCPVHDEAIGNLKDRDSRLELKIDGVGKKVDVMDRKITRWGGAFAVLVPSAMAAITIAARLLMP